MAAALYHRERTGRGQKIEVRLIDCYLTCHEISIELWSSSDGATEPNRSGSLHAFVPAYGVFATADGDLMIGVGNDRQWAQLARADHPARSGPHRGLLDRPGGRPRPRRLPRHGAAHSFRHHRHAGVVTNIPAVGTSFTIRVRGDAGTIIVRATSAQTGKRIDGTLTLAGHAGPTAWFDVARVNGSELR